MTTMATPSVVNIQSDHFLRSFGTVVEGEAEGQLILMLNVKLFLLRSYWYEFKSYTFKSANQDVV